MPELPEVETIVRGLKDEITGSVINSINTDAPNLFKGPDFKAAQKILEGKMITAVSRRAKNILFSLSDGNTLIVHLKMTGHILVTDENTEIKNGKWIVDPTSSLSDPNNQYIHVVWHLSQNKKMALSDLRKFANILIKKPNELQDYFKDYGPEPLSEDFNADEFYKELMKKKQPLKKFLLDQHNISGIGNIYADEILFEAKLLPNRLTSSLSKVQFQQLFASIQKVLIKAVRLRGTSVSDYRDIKGKKGGYGAVRTVYRRTGENCPRGCNQKIERIIIAGRGTHYCSKCQR